MASEFERGMGRLPEIDMVVSSEWVAVSPGAADGLRGWGMEDADIRIVTQEIFPRYTYGNSLVRLREQVQRRPVLVVRDYVDRELVAMLRGWRRPDMGYGDCGELARMVKADADFVQVMAKPAAVDVYLLNGRAPIFYCNPDQNHVFLGCLRWGEPDKQMVYMDPALRTVTVGDYTVLGQPALPLPATGVARMGVLRQKREGWDLQGGNRIVMGASVTGNEVWGVGFAYMGDTWQYYDRGKLIARPLPVISRTGKSGYLGQFFFVHPDSGQIDGSADVNTLSQPSRWELTEMLATLQQFQYVTQQPIPADIPNGTMGW